MNKLFILSLLMIQLMCCSDERKQLEDRGEGLCKYKDVEELLLLARQDPLGYLKAGGLTYRQITDFILTDDGFSCEKAAKNWKKMILSQPEAESMGWGEIDDIANKMITQCYAEQWSAVHQSCLSNAKTLDLLLSCKEPLISDGREGEFYHPPYVFSSKDGRIKYRDAWVADIYEQGIDLGKHDIPTEYYGSVDSCVKSVKDRIEKTPVWWEGAQHFDGGWYNFGITCSRNCSPAAFDMTYIRPGAAWVCEDVVRFRDVSYRPPYLNKIGNKKGRGVWRGI